MKTLLTIIISCLLIGTQPRKEIYDKGEFIFSVKIYDNEQEMKLRFFPVQYTGDNKEEFDNAWELTKDNLIDKNTVVYLGMEIMEGKINGNQKPYQYKYYNSEFEKIGMEATGMIENDSTIWLHPPRDRYFKILELNPFPEIQFDKENWQTTLEVGEHWGNERWKTWKGNIIINSDYSYNRDDGKVTAIANSELGITHLVTDFDKMNGLKKLDYTNIDGSRIVLELIEKRE
ncbi:hypothetical protein [Aequorivita viscosa]|uniref:Uncharacterized protein n=1 Tax=Aequorivita viscosa TaxID=797419 RepID=A0A1M6PRV7_9FLAO|nr:hypothetical protein [Aequorivita viscosa]SDX58014.1 hypothetical protein SAMN05216556_1541 [Aequorivita viscosa]SHK10704.1 hypothetical protein SAMN04487908_1571 [Aequorivita viscosa]